MSRTPRRRGPATLLPQVMAVLSAALLVVGGLGCQAPSDATPLVLTIDGPDYGRTFDAAVEVLNDHGLSPAFRDRRAGTIESEAVVSAGIWEPWRLEPASDAASIAGSATVRRRVRVDFQPAGFAPIEPVPDDLRGPDLFAVDGIPIDLEAAEDPIEVRLEVLLERAHRPGTRPHPWSRRLSSVTRVGRTDEPGRFEPGLTWWPVGRDHGLERALLADVARAVAGRAAAIESDADADG